MGDPAAEDLFVLAALTGIKNIQVILCPVDFRSHSAPPPLPEAPGWLEKLYKQIESELHKFPEPSRQPFKMGVGWERVENFDPPLLPSHRTLKSSLTNS
jgi:hypothetical protein